MSIEIRSVAATDVRQFSQWQYEPPYGVYDIGMEPGAAVDYFLQEDVRCHVLIEETVLIGFCTFGRDAQVHGGDYEDDLLDIGLGMHPSRTDSGIGRRYVEAVVDFALGRYGPNGFRVTIADANRRAVNAWTAAGFSELSKFETDREILNSHDWIVLRRDAS